MTINVVLFQPEIPQNTGNIMRTCAGTDTKLHLIKPLGFNLDEKTIKRSGAGYVDQTDYTVYEDWEDFVSKNQGSYYFVTRCGKQNYSKVKYHEIKEDIYLVFGSESSGIPNSILKSYFENCLRVPMNDKIRSLNLANTVCLVLYEVLRQFDFNDLLTLEPFKGENYILENE